MTNANTADAPAEPFPSLTTLRLTLREIVPTDAASLLAIHGDREAMRWFGNDPIASLAEAEKMVQTFAGWRQPPSWEPDGRSSATRTAASSAHAACSDGTGTGKAAP